MSRKFVVIVALCCSSVACGGPERPTSIPAGLSTSAMVRAVRAIVNLAVAAPESTADLSACPLGDFDTLVGKAPAEVQADAALDAQLFASVSQADGVPYVQCGRGDLVVLTGEVPGDHYREDLIAMLSDFVLTFDNERAYRAGTVARYCAEPNDPSAQSFCGADWFNHQVWIGVFIRGDERSSAQAEEWLAAILSDVVANVPLVAPSVQLAD